MTGVIREDRPNVLWISDNPVPVDLQTALDTRDLVITPCLAKDVDSMSSSARATVIEIGGGSSFDSAQVLSILPRSLEQGHLVVLTHSPATSRDDYYTAASAIPQDGGGRIRSLYRDVQRIAQSIATHDPGPGASAALLITPAGPYPGELEFLLRRAFNDVGSIEVGELTPGRSSATVWQVFVRGADARRYPIPFLVKCNTIAKAREEQNKFLDQVADRLASRHRPGLHTRRCAIGESEAVLVQEFVLDAQPLRGALRSGNSSLIGQLFEKSLSGWYAHCEPISGPLHSVFQDVGALRWSKDLKKAALRADELYGQVYPIQLLKRMCESLTFDYHATTAHCDLHADNAFAVAGTSEVVVIDFARTMLAPVVADFACLETSLVFPSRLDEEVGANGPLYVGDNRCALTALNKAEVIELYQSVDPMSPPLHGADRWIRQAIRAIRSYWQPDKNRRPYTFAIAAYLIRFASNKGHAHLDDRALAYDIAVRLLETL